MIDTQRQKVQGASKKRSHQMPKIQKGFWCGYYLSLGRQEKRIMKNLQFLRFLVGGTLLLPVLAFSYSGVVPLKSQIPSPLNVARSNQFASSTNRHNCGSRLVASENSRHYTALAAASAPPIGLFRHVGILFTATFVVKGLKRGLSSKDEKSPVGVMQRCPWPFIFFHDPKQGLKDTPTWITLLYVVMWRCVKAYQIFKPSR